MLKEFATSLAVDALCDAVLIPRGPVDDPQAPLCEVFLADLGETGKVLTLKEVPPLFLSGTGAEIIVLAGANRVESILYAELLDVAGALLVAMHA